MLMKAHRLKQVDLDARIHQLAFLCFAVKAEKKSGKSSRPIFNKFKKFYDYEAELQKVEDEFESLNDENKNEKKSRFAGIGKLLK